MADSNLTRFEEVKRRLTSWKVKYSKYNLAADMLYDVEDADEDFKWLIYEVERLRQENAHLKEFASFVREDVEKEVGPLKRPES